MNEPIPSDVRTIYGGKIDTCKTYINGKEVPLEQYLPIERGIFDTHSGVVVYYNSKKGEEE